MNLAPHAHSCAGPHKSAASDALKLLEGLQPAFQHRLTGESHLSQDDTGRPISSYSFSNLPAEWITERDIFGYAQALHPDVVPGYWRDARFIALDQLSSLPLDG